MQNIASDTSAIKKSVGEVQSAITVLTDRVGEAEGRIVKMEERTDSFAEALQTTLRQLEAVKERVEDLDNRGRRNNLRILAIPEDAEGNNMIQFLQNEIPKMLKHAFEGPLEIERAHRALAPKPREGQRPRAIILKLLMFQIKEEIIRRAREMRYLAWHESSIMIFPDYLKILVDKRRAFASVKKDLHTQGIKFSLRYPAILVIYLNGASHSFATPEEASDFVKRRTRKAGTQSNPND
ncbi:hypothetical protein HHUSO_G4660 [Huso huso]|uniref:L1 transposable element RRM domain-containing protein n=1 Tax=Huso huso TaxID=61971 RepID=A0ABR0ZZE1_HUSHU